jgi:hypothetical protein
MESREILNKEKRKELFCNGSKSGRKDYSKLVSLEDIEIIRKALEAAEKQIEQLQDEKSELSGMLLSATKGYSELQEENNRLKGLLWEAWITSAGNLDHVFINEDFENILFKKWLDKHNIKL